ncbi:MAG: PAS domain S-box protein [Calditrichaeota bacterium]|nr:PAS domain S-box protein [Calditrichota bacterium]
MQYTEYIKVLVQTPTKELFHFLQKNFIYQNLEIFYLPQLIEMENFIQKIRPQIIILYIDENPGKYRLAIQILEKIYQLHKSWFILLYHPDVDIEKLRSTLPGNRFVLLPEKSDFFQIAHNLAFVKDTFQNLSILKAKVEIADNFNYCLKIIQKERELPRLFERLINYLPKTVLMDYWALFTVDASMREVKHFVQFVPPTRRKYAILTHQLERLAQSWLAQGRSIALAPADDPQLFRKLVQWGWPVKRLYFVPIKVQGMAIGGFLIGSVNSRTLASHEILLINDLADALGEKILDTHLSEHPEATSSDFSDQLIMNRFSEDSIFYLACKIMNQITHADSTVFWQYNKGFGFLFPKHFYFENHAGDTEAIEKNVIFLNKEQFFSRLIQQGKMQFLPHIVENRRLGESTRNIFSKLHYRNLFIIPIKIYNEVIGVFIINKQADDAKFSVWEIHRLGEIIQRVQKVLEDTHIVKEAQLKLKQLARIFELGNELKLDLSLEDVLRRIAGNLRKSLGWNDIAFLLLDEVHRTLRLSARLGFDNPQKLPVKIDEPLELEKFQLFISRCEKINNSYFYDSMPLLHHGNGKKVEAGQVIEWNDQDLLVVPLETRNKTLGYLLVHDPVDRLKPTQDKVVPLEYYANQAAIAVENAQLYERLLASEERYRTLAETMSLGLVTCDLTGKIIYVNPAFQRLLGYRHPQLVNRRLIHFFDKKSREKFKEIATELISGKSDEKTRIENVELEIVSSSGAKIPVSVFAFPFFQHRQKVGFFMVLNDLRVIKRLERMKADFNSMIVHDLRSPMNVIQGFLELIRNRVVGEINSEQEELLDIAKENVKKVLTLIDNFLVASKIEVGKFSIDPKLNEINGLIERVVTNMKVLTRNKKINIHLDLDRNLPLLFFDSLRVEQVLNNLLSNAMKFTPEGGDIYIRSELMKKKIKGEDKFFAHISVQDTGVGIPPDKLETIFDKYEQTGAEARLNVGGTGLGLAICKEIVNLHGGEIWVESELEKGSTFHFTFPIEPTVEKVMK